jgi:hypothetical protein
VNVCPDSRNNPAPVMVVCPTCDAQPGQFCRDRRGQIVRAHDTRRAVAGVADV